MVIAQGLEMSWRGWGPWLMLSHALSDHSSLSDSLRTDKANRCSCGWSLLIGPYATDHQYVRVKRRVDKALALVSPWRQHARCTQVYCGHFQYNVAPSWHRPARLAHVHCTLSFAQRLQSNSGLSGQGQHIRTHAFACATSNPGGMTA